MDRRRPDMRALVTVGGVAIPDSSEYEATSSTVVDSARNVKGYMIGSVIRSDIGKVTCKWKFLDAQTWADICQLFNENSGGHFINDVTFFNQGTNGWETRKMYVSDLTCGIYLRKNNGSVIGYKDCRLALIEV